MKTSVPLLLMLCSLLAFNLILTSNLNKKREEIIGEEYNFDPKEGSPKGAISYALASNKKYTLSDDKPYIAPTFVPKLPAKMDTPASGPSEIVEEVPTVSDYYDGSNKLNSVTVKCTVYVDPNECFKQSSCGWCGSTKSCILGNNVGPLQACVKSSYIFSAGQILNKRNENSKKTK